MRTSTLLVALLGLVAVVSAARYSRTVSYEGQKVYRCKWSHQEVIDRVMYGLLLKENVDIWGRTADHVDIRLTVPQQKNLALKAFTAARCTVVHEDLETVMQEEEAMLFPQGKAEWFEEYHTYDEIKAWYQALAASYPTLAKFTPSIGTTLEGRALFGFTFTGRNGVNKPKIFFQCQIHAREWISGATCGYIINELLTGYGNNTEVTSILDAVEFVVNPIQNPDGYAYTWSGDRLWRKNRNPNGGACYGVDINRNYNDHWGQGGSSTSPCSDTYMGASAGSELETKASVAFFRSHAPIIGAIDWHSYSQLILRPYGWTRTNSPDEAQLKALGDGMAAAIEGVHGLEYTSQKSIDLYVTTGTASDWFYGDDATSTNDGYKAAGFTIELRDTGRYGFQLPPAQIIPTGEENFAAVIYFVKQILANPIEA